MGAMRETTTLVATEDGAMPTFITHPEEGGPFAPILLYMDIWGIRDELREIARRIATVGYCCALPDLYYRQGRVSTGFRDQDGRMISLHRLNEERARQVHAPRDKSTSAMAMADTASLIAHIDTLDAARPGPVGSIGWCMGGRLVLLAAGHYPERMQAGASLHGTRLISDAEDSPHLLAEKFQGELYCGFGERDHFSPPELIEEMETLLSPLPVAYSHLVHKGAEHGYALPDRDIYEPTAAASDWERIFAMYRRVLTPAPSSPRP